MKIPLTYGAVMAIGGALLTFVLYFAGFHDDVEKMQSTLNQILAVVAPLLIAITCLALAMRDKRSSTPDEVPWGYGSAFGVGILTALFGAIFGAIFAYLYSAFLNPGMAEVLFEMQVAKMEEKGLSSQQIEGAERTMRMMLSPAALSIFQGFSGFLVTTVMALVIAIFFKNRSGPNASTSMERPSVL